MIMLTKYVCCEDCDYQEHCEQFDPFFGCNSGKQRLLNTHPLLNEREDITIFQDNMIERMLGE